MTLRSRATAWKSRLLLAALAAGAALPLPAKPAPPLSSVWLPRNASLEGVAVDRLFVSIFIITAVVLVLVQATLVYFLVRYRRREGRPARYVTGNTRLEVVWTLIPTLILVVLALASRSAWARMKGGLYEDRAADAAAFQLLVEPQQFQWNVRYPGADGKLDTDDDVKSVNVIHVPVGRPVLIRLKSHDVIHSFFVPELRVKQDAVPGLLARVRFTVTRPGKWQVECAELCGLGHYRMRAFLTAESQAEVDEWLRQRSSGN